MKITTSILALSLALAPSLAAAETIDISGSILNSKYVGLDLANASLLEFATNIDYAFAGTVNGVEEPGLIQNFHVSSPMFLSGDWLIGSGGSANFSTYWDIGTDHFAEILDTIVSVNRNFAGNTLSVELSGYVYDSQGLFNNDPTVFTLQAMNDLGNGNIGWINFDPAFSNDAPANGSPATPEASTVIMVGMGLAVMAGFGWQRKARKTRTIKTL